MHDEASISGSNILNWCIILSLVLDALVFLLSLWYPDSLSFPPFPFDWFLVDTLRTFFFFVLMPLLILTTNTRKYSPPPPTMEYTILNWLSLSLFLAYSVDWCLCADIGNHCRRSCYVCVCVFYYLYLVTIVICSDCWLCWVQLFSFPIFSFLHFAVSTRFVSLVLGNAYRTVHRYNCLLRFFYLSRMNELRIEF